MKKMFLLVVALAVIGCTVPDDQRINQVDGSEAGHTLGDPHATERAKRQRARQAQLMKSDRRG
jgi:hypothetical protein